MILPTFVFILSLIHLTICLPLGLRLSLTERVDDTSHAPFAAYRSKIADRQDGNGGIVRRNLEIRKSTPSSAAAANFTRNVYLAAPFTENPLTLSTSFS